MPQPIYPQMSPIPQMERLHHPIHAGFGRHLEGTRAFHFKSVSICVIGVIGDFKSLFQVYPQREMAQSRIMPALPTQWRAFQRPHHLRHLRHLRIKKPFLV